MGPAMGPAMDQHTPPTMIEIFRRVLEADDVTDTSDFFEAGGDSLLATRVLSAIAHEYDVELTFDDFVIAPSPDALAAPGREPASVRTVVVGARPRRAHRRPRAGRGGGEVVVLEARDRVGGRMRGIEVAPGEWVDAGAAYLGERHTALHDLLAVLGLKTVPTEMTGTAGSCSVPAARPAPAASHL